MRQAVLIAVGQLRVAAAARQGLLSIAVDRLKVFGRVGRVL